MKKQKIGFMLCFILLLMLASPCFAQEFEHGHFTFIVEIEDQIIKAEVPSERNPRLDGKTVKYVMTTKNNPNWKQEINNVLKSYGVITNVDPNLPVVKTLEKKVSKKIAEAATTRPELINTPKNEAINTISSTNSDNIVLLTLLLILAIIIFAGFIVSKKFLANQNGQKQNQRSVWQRLGRFYKRNDYIIIPLACFSPLIIYIVACAFTAIFHPELIEAAKYQKLKESQEMCQVVTISLSPGESASTYNNYMSDDNNYLFSERHEPSPRFTDDDRAGLTLAGGMASGIAGGAAAGFAVGGPFGAVAGAILGNFAGGAVGSIFAE